MLNLWKRAQISQNKNGKKYEISKDCLTIDAGQAGADLRDLRPQCWHSPRPPGPRSTRDSRICRARARNRRSLAPARRNTLYLYFYSLYFRDNINFPASNILLPFCGRSEPLEGNFSSDWRAGKPTCEEENEQRCFVWKYAYFYSKIRPRLCDFVFDSVNSFCKSILFWCFYFL